MKKTVLALALGLTIGSAGTAIAATSETVQAVFAKFNFVVNGESKQLATDPLVVDGTSYLPVREVAALLGFGLEYDADSRTIKLDNGIKTGTGSAGGTTTEKPKGDDSVTTINEEWISLRSLKEMHSNISITIPDPKESKMHIVNGETNYIVDVPAEGTAIDTPIGKIKLENGVILLEKNAVLKVLAQ